MSNRLIALTALAALAGCDADPREANGGFPVAGRAVAPIVSDRFSTEDARDRVGEAEQVMELAGIVPGMSVADIGAGEGYYTIRLANAVGPGGRVLAQDIIPETRDALARRVQREELENVSVRLGASADPRLPPASFDRIFLVHMYHEVTEPYEFLWNLRQGLRQGGEVVVVDADRPIKRHGMPPGLLDCEFAALGMERIRTAEIAGADAYFAAFRISRELPEPSEIDVCEEDA
ncbi:class I SAM-dependent methyltransferase [Sphingomicrobium clamense]|uniref:Protein-L-isoaspartate O-methyltransferase n=1 Tax=Sphingomicrobium clamense TaxID=2851013 RepID=A0ABS6V4Q4_9SPHN|nr:methyltransferase domain-containing protein [Sphingomicrobium sp. B8]MBW0144535.1 protein-L-isoaspartate O-methyltransferase [Sphingomicrobium sp. B8]